MKKISEKAVFFGSGPVAAKSLELLNEYCDLEAVITKPRKNLYQSDPPVYTIANKLNIPILYASNKSELDQLFDTANIKSKIGILIDFGIIISQKVIDKFEYGIINSHFSILPEWRGPDPISFSLLSGQAETGVSLMKLVLKMDEGQLLNFKSIKITGDIDSNQLTDSLIDLSNQLIQEALPKYLAKALRLMDQTETGKKVSYSKIIKKSDGIIDVNKPAIEIERQIRAFIAWPKSRLLFKDKTLVITKAIISDEEGQAGDFFTTKDNELGLYFKTGSLIIKKLVPAGKKEMTSKDFLIGNRSSLLI